jgi:protein ImuB
VHTNPIRAEVVDVDGKPVAVGGRGSASAEPKRVSVDGGEWREVVAWAGPWPVDERWWDPGAHRRRARWQVVTADGTAHLLAVEGGRWSVEATYD